MRAPAAMACAILLVAAPLPARATITIVNMDGPNEGFNDTTTIAPVGGNPGTTVGQQRLNVFDRAAQIWDAIVQSPVEIRIQASFDPLTCNASSAVLGSAGPNTVESDFAGATFPGTWYVTAEANRLTGTDLEPGTDDITAQFNSSIGQAGCLTGRNWYYGFDDNEGATGIDLLPVLLHEFGHGLGFLTTTDESTGNYLAGQPTIFDRYLMDDQSGKHWFEMTPAERVASAINTDHLVWDGPSVMGAAPRTLGKRPHVVTSGALTGDFMAGEGVIGPRLTTTGVSGDLVRVNDGVSPTSDGCESPFVNAAAVAGKIAVIDRGTCTFAQKAINAQAAGAIAMLIVNNAAGPAPAVGGSAPTVTIPVASVSQADGGAIETAMGSGTVHAKLALDPAHLAGANDAEQVWMFAPNPDQPGSSVSHWDVAAFPNLLMEPAINPDLTTNVDLTYNAFDDIGWFPQLAAVGGNAAGVALAAAPNPAAQGGTLRFRLPVAGRVELSVFDAAGRRVARLAQGPFTAGEHAVAWDGRDAAGHPAGPGVYLVRLRSGALERTTSVVLLR